MQELQVWPLGREDSMEKERATRSSILAWETPGTEEPGGLQSIESQRVGHDWATKQQQHCSAGMWGNCVNERKIIRKAQTTKAHSTRTMRQRKQAYTSVSKIEFLAKNLPQKETGGPDGFIGESYQTCKEETISTEDKLSRKLKFTFWFIPWGQHSPQTKTRQTNT